MKSVIVRGTYTKQIQCPVEFTIHESDVENWKSYVEDNLKYFSHDAYEMNGGYGSWNPGNFQNYPIENIENIQWLNIKDIFIEKDGNEVRYIPPVEIDRAEVELESYFENLFN